MEAKKRKGKFLLPLAACLVCLLAGLLLPPLIPVPGETVTMPSGREGERVAALEGNDDALLWRLRLIRSAREKIILSTFDLRPDQTGAEMLAALQEAADRGVEIRILADGICGTMYLSGSDRFRALAADDRVEVRFYNPVRLLKPWTLNYRMHDKYLIADDLAYVLGGRNSYDLFLREDLERYNIDRDLLIYVPRGGGSLTDLEGYFTEVWDLSEPFTPRDSQRLTQTRQALRLQAAGLAERYPALASEPDYEGATFPADRVTLLCNPTRPGNKAPVLWKQLCLLMDTGEEVLIQTPYIILDRQMYRDLEGIGRKGTLRIMTNAPENGANPFGCADFLNQKHNLVALGAETLEWLGGQSLHTKTVLIGQNLSVVGSFNLDMRSAYLDTELMLAVDCPQLNRQLREGFGDMAAASRSTTREGERLGASCPRVQMPLGKRLLYPLLRILLWPVRHLL